VHQVAGQGHKNWRSGPDRGDRATHICTTYHPRRNARGSRGWHTRHIFLQLWCGNIAIFRTTTAFQPVWPPPCAPAFVWQLMKYRRAGPPFPAERALPGGKIY